MTPTADHPPQPNDGQLRVLFSSAGITFFDDRSPGILGRTIEIILKHGRLTISSARQSDAETMARLQNRHIQNMHRIATSPARLRIELSDMCVDIFDGLSPSELEWAQTVLESELEHHRRRKDAAMANANLPDRWRVPGPFNPTWQETKGLILFASLIICSMISVICIGQVSTACAAIDGLPLDPELKLRLVEWVPATMLSLALSAQLGRSVYRWQRVAETPQSPHRR
jgi:hypothetical protein